MRNARHALVIPSSYPRRTIVVLSTYYRHTSPGPCHTLVIPTKYLGEFDHRSHTSYILTSNKHTSPNQTTEATNIREFPAKCSSYPRQTLVVPSSYPRHTLVVPSSCARRTLVVPSSYPRHTPSYLPNTSGSSIMGPLPLTYQHPTRTTHLTRRLKQNHRKCPCEMPVIPSSYPRRTLVIPLSYLVIPTKYFGEFDHGSHTSYISTSNKNNSPDQTTETKTSRN